MVLLPPAVVKRCFNVSRLFSKKCHHEVMVGVTAAKVAARFMCSIPHVQRCATHTPFGDAVDASPKLRNCKLPGGTRRYLKDCKLPREVTFFEFWLEPSLPLKDHKLCKSPKAKDCKLPVKVIARRHRKPQRRA